jgi:glyoxylase-like metal-dependent hydrolase (beta-lactamase superfamily II)
VLVSHYHDDHVAGIPLLQKLQGTECWAAESFAPILEHPQDYAFPCMWHVPIRVDRELPLGGLTRFHEYEFELGPAFSGHTRFAALIGFEADGVRYAHTGDQYHGSFSWDPAHKADWTTDVIAPNEVYRNGMLLDGYRRSAEWLLRWRPDIVLTGHQRAFETDDAFFERVIEHGRRIEESHRHLMALDEGSSHFDADSWGGWIRPYRTYLNEPGSAAVTVIVRNPLPRRAQVEIKLILPEGWSGDASSVEAESRQETACELTFTATTPCRRLPISAEVVVAGQPYGQVAEALVTVGGTGF